MTACLERFSASPVRGAQTGKRADEPAASKLLIDGHVHFYRCFDETLFLEGARANFARACAASGFEAVATGRLLLLTETADDHFFGDLARRRRLQDPAWSVCATAEDISLVVCRDGGDAIVLIAGRQIVTREQLEVLAVGTDAALPDGQDLGTTIEATRAAGAIPVLPWGFGKWWGHRGALVSELLERAAPGRIFLGDNGGRSGLGPPPRQFAQAARRGILVLPGSDPLPLAAEAARAGRYGFVLEGGLDRSRPAEGLKRLLLGLERQPPSYGQLQPFWPFVSKQLAMQWRKRRRAA